MKTNTHRNIGAAVLLLGGLAGATSANAAIFLQVGGDKPRLRRLYPTNNRKTTRWAALAGAVLLGTQVAVLAPAAAALPGAVVTSEISPFDSENKTIAARCPAGKRVTGGGGRVNGFTSHVVLTRLQPVHTNNLDRFEVAAAEDETGTAGQWAVQAFAICADPLPGQEIITRTRAAQSNQFDVALADCPASKLVIGSGGRIANGQGQVDLHSLSLFSFGTSTLVRGSEDSTGFAGNWSVSANAVCATLAVGSHDIVQSGSATDPTDRKFAMAECPSGMRVTSGAAIITGNYNPNVVLESIAPQVFPQGVPGFQIRVIAKENNPTNNDWGVQAIAYCAA